MKKIVVGMMLAASVLSTASASAAGWGDWVPQNVGATVTQYASYAGIIKKTWDKQSLENIIQGKFDVPDEAINAVLEQEVSDSDQVKALKVTSRSDGRLDIHADTKTYGGVDISGTIDSCVHDGDTSYITYTVKDKDLENHGSLTGWMFSHISLSMMEKLVGHIEVSDDVTTKIKSNTVTVDYSQALKKSEFAQASVAGYNLLDALRIEGAVPHDGYIEIETSLNVPDGVKDTLRSILD